VLRQSIQQSVGLGLARMGADLLVVPRQTTTNLTAALLTVEPTPHTFPRSTALELARLPGVESAAPQRYHQLSDGASDHDQNDLIAFEPGNDFTVLPWLAGKLDRPMRRGDLIVGGRREEAVGAEVHFFGREFTIYGKLALTGVGPFERSYFASFDTVADIAAAAQKTTGQSVLDVDPDKLSALLVRMQVGATAEQFRFAAARVPEVRVVAGNPLFSSVRQGVSAILSAAVGLTLLMLLSTTLMVAAMYSGLLAERRRELGLFLAIGLRPRHLERMILAEAALTTATGGIAGVLLGAAGIVLFERSLGFYFESFQVPFSLPPFAWIAAAAAFSVVVAAAVGVVGVLVPARRAGRREPYQLVSGET